MLTQTIEYKPIRKNVKMIVSYHLNGKLVETSSNNLPADLARPTVTRTAPIAAWYRLARHLLTPEMESTMLKEEGYRK